MTKPASFKKIWTHLHKYNRSMVNKSNKNKTTKSKGINTTKSKGINTTKSKGINTTKSKGIKSKKTGKFKGGFIRAGSTQHFYAPCNTNEVILDKNNQSFQQKMETVNTSQMATNQNK